MRSSARYKVRPLQRTDFEALMRLEDEVFGGAGEAVLGPYYVRLCCEFFGQSCFVAEAEGRPVGYALCFMREREAYCTTLAVCPEYQGTRVLVLLLRALVDALHDKVDACWFTVKADNGAARTLHSVLGAHDVEVRQDFYGPGDERIVSRIERQDLERVRGKYERLGLVRPRLELVQGAQ